MLNFILLLNLQKRMHNFFNRYFNTWKARVAMRDCAAQCYSVVEHQAIARVQYGIKDFLNQYGDETLLMDIYDNTGKFNPLLVGQKPVGRQNYTIAELVPFTSVKDEIAPFLLLLASRLKPKSVLELGTHLGISGMYLASGVSLNPHGVLYTIDRSNNSLKYAETILKPWKDRIKIINGEFPNVFQEILSESGKIGLAFIDGDHQEKSMVEYSRIIFPAMNRGGVVVFDDINWSSYAVEEWKKVSADRHVFFSKDCGRFGFIIVK